MRHSTNNFKIPYEERIHFSPSLNWYQSVKGASGCVLDGRAELISPLTSCLMNQPYYSRWGGGRFEISSRCCGPGVPFPVLSCRCLSSRINSHLFLESDSAKEVGRRFSSVVCGRWESSEWAARIPSDQVVITCYHFTSNPFQSRTSWHRSPTN